MWISGFDGDDGHAGGPCAGVGERGERAGGRQQDTHHRIGQRKARDEERREGEGGEGKGREGERRQDTHYRIEKREEERR
jgi:hypothetical protein